MSRGLIIFDFDGTLGDTRRNIVNILCDEKYLAEDGKPDVEKMELITFDPVHHTYIQLGKTVGNAFSDGKQFLDKPSGKAERK